MRKALLLLLITICSSFYAYGGKIYETFSPNGNIMIKVTISDGIYYDIFCKGNPLLEQGNLQMRIDNQLLGVHPQIKKVNKTTVNECFKPVVPFKFSKIINHYNQLLLDFRGNYSVEFRVYDDGIAYRFITNKKGMVEIDDELFQISLPENSLLHVQQSNAFRTSYEEPYSHLSLKEWNQSSNKYTLLPVLIETEKKYKILISEANLTDYPAMFLTAKGGPNKLNSIFPKVPLKLEKDTNSNLQIVEEEEFHAVTSGTRNFPWRYFVITDDDGQLIENTMTARLSEPCLISNSEWICPGVTAWEWWTGATPYGPDVNFVAGCNTDTYKYYIDFASEFGLNYILLDVGWAENIQDPYSPNKDLDLQKLIQYGNEKHVGVILWLPWQTVENNFDLFKTYSSWGIKGVKIDFMKRSDQWMVNFYERVAAEAAKNKLIIDFHGSFKP